MKYAYCVLPLGPFGGSTKTIWLASEPNVGLREAAEIYAAAWKETTVTQLDLAGFAVWRTSARFRLFRPGYEALTIAVTLL